MSTTTQTVSIPSDWIIEAHQLWMKGERTEAIQAVIIQLNQHGQQKPPHLLKQLSYYLFLIEDYPSAAQVMEQLCLLTPQDAENLRNLAVCYLRSGQPELGVDFIHRSLALEPDNITSWDGLASGLSRLRRWDEAAQAGTRALSLKDATSEAHDVGQWQIPQQAPAEFVANKRHVISYSLWGANPRYLRGALRNALLIPELYPDWQMRLYTDDSVPAEFLSLVQTHGVDVRLMPAQAPLREKLCWRFLVANDPEVGYFLVRDCDSVVGIREVRAVDEWLASEQFFHVIRDWWSHTDLILAGLWGGVAGVLPDMHSTLLAYRSPHLETPNIDQWFLRDCIWRYVRRSVMTHDRCFSLPNSIRLTPAANGSHIGQNEAVTERQTLALQAWIAQYPCLQSAG